MQLVNPWPHHRAYRLNQQRLAARRTIPNEALATTSHTPLTLPKLSAAEARFARRLAAQPLTLPLSDEPPLNLYLRWPSNTAPAAVLWLHLGVGDDSCGLGISELLLRRLCPPLSAEALLSLPATQLPELCTEWLRPALQAAEVLFQATVKITVVSDQLPAASADARLFATLNTTDSKGTVSDGAALWLAPDNNRLEQLYQRLADRPQPCTERPLAIPLPLRVNIGQATLTESQLAGLATDDLIVADLSQGTTVSVASQSYWSATLSDDGTSLTLGTGIAPEQAGGDVNNSDSGTATLTLVAASFLLPANQVSELSSGVTLSLPQPIGTGVYLHRQQHILAAGQLFELPPAEGRTTANAAPESSTLTLLRVAAIY